MASTVLFCEEYDSCIRRERVFRDRTMQLEILSDDELYARYRMPRSSLFPLLDKVRPLIEHPTKRSHALTPETQFLVTLRFLSKGGFLLEMGDLHGVHQSSVSRAFHRTVSALSTVLENVQFPEPASFPAVMCGFHKIAEMPRVIGAIDGTLIPIKRPSGDDESAFVCRKGFHAINVQAVCDANLRFTNVVARWPGGSHDSMILANSLLGQTFESSPPTGWLLGDSGYACRPWLLTPVGDATTRPQQRYNGAHMKTRNTIERAFGVLKSRFRCLHKSSGCLQFTPQKCAQIIMVAFKLHNFCIESRLANPPALEEETVPELNYTYQGPLNDGHRMRKELIQNKFA